MLKPKVFIGSSVEQLPTARAVRGRLYHDASVVIWDEGVFNLNNSTLDDLLRFLEEFDFAIFIFSPDDTTHIRDSQKQSVRDNVVFELGLFMGRIGKHRTFWITPDLGQKLRIPTDLEGINRAKFMVPPAEQPLAAAVGPACDQIRDELSKLGRRSDRVLDEFESPRILCAASPQYAELGFMGDVEAITSGFPGVEVTVSHKVSAAELRDLLVKNRFDIVHLVSFIDPETGDVVLGDVAFESERGKYEPGKNVVPAEGFAKLIEMANVRLVVLNTCDSLALAARIARLTNVVAGFALIGVPTAVEWSQMFYPLMARGKTLSQAFDVSQKATDAGMVLLTKKDFRITPSTVT
jgi:hypothetical protein